MKIPKWTKADAKRAEKMGWKLLELKFDIAKVSSLCTSEIMTLRSILSHGDLFKSDAEAIEWVLDVHLDDLPPCSAPEDFITCRKALFLCALG